MLKVLSTGLGAGIAVVWAATPTYGQAREPTVVAPEETTSLDSVSDSSGAQGGARSRELLRRDCSSTLGARDLTLFANGTLRLRERDGDKVKMWLAELGHDEVGSFAVRLRAPSLVETDSRYRTLVGDLVESCRLRLDLPGRQPMSFEYDAHTPLSLDLDQVLAVVGELEKQIDRTAPPEGSERLASDYTPRTGDVLVRADDGALFRIVGRTQDLLHYELQGLQQPVTLFVSGDEFSRRFTALLSRR